MFIQNIFIFSTYNTNILITIRKQRENINYNLYVEPC